MPKIPILDPADGGLLPGLIVRPGKPPNPGRDAPRSGYLIHQKPERHACDLPMTGFHPAVPVGVAWRCTCGRLWEVEEALRPQRGQVLADRRQWQPARLITRWRHWRGHLVEFTPPPPAPRPRPPARPSGTYRPEKEHQQP